MRTYSSHRLPPTGQHDEGSVGNRAQGAQGDRLVEDGRAAELHDVRRFAGRRLQRRAQRLVEEQRRGADTRDAVVLVFPGADHHLFAALPAQDHEVRSRLLQECRRVGDTLGEELLRARYHLGGRKRDGGRVDHGVRRIVMPVGCRGMGMLATRARVVRSMTSTAPGSIPTLSCEMNAQRPSGEYATPCGSGFVVGILATSVSVWASTSDTLCAFLFVTMIHRPSADGSTL